MLQGAGLGRGATGATARSLARAPRGSGRPADIPPADTSDLASDARGDKDPLGLRPNHSQRGWPLAALLFTHGAPLRGPGSRGYCRHHALARHGRLHRTYSLGGGHRPPPASRRGLKNRALLAAGGLGLVGLAALQTGAPGLDERQLFYPPLPRLLPRLAGPGGPLGALGARLAYAGTNIPYYLFGTGLRNEVAT